MHIYEKPYYAALSEFVEKYLVLGLATVFSMLSIAILLKMNNYNDAFNVYFFVSIITIVFAIPYWYWMGFKRIKKFRIDISNSIMICDDIIPFSEIKEVYTTPTKNIVIVSSKNAYRIYNSISHYDDLLNKLCNIASVIEKSEAKTKILYSIDLFLVVIYLSINISLIVVPIGIYLIFSYIKEITKIKRYKILSVVLDVLIITIVGYKLVIHVSYLL